MSGHLSTCPAYALAALPCECPARLKRSEAEARGQRTEPPAPATARDWAEDIGAAIFAAAFIAFAIAGPALIAPDGAASVRHTIEFSNP